MSNKKTKFVMAGRGSDADYLAFSSEVGRRIYASQLDRRVCERLGIYTVSHLPELPTLLPDCLAESEVSSYLVIHSMNPYELALLWQEAKLEACLWLSKESYIAEYLRPFPKADFERWGDSNCLGGVSRRWLDKAGLHLDVQAMELSENAGWEVSVDDLIEFVKAYGPGTYRNPAHALVERIEGRWREVVGFGLKSYYVEHLLKICERRVSVLEDFCPF